ncbi:MAG: AbrB/MazE/SpoVT family DNA-binding domain-containing protein [Rhizobiaceae bacterium]|nr:AbrB/MazE/SpoVT family DNA-binding domain-containing protein [Rhizobiaceae bacterium]
MAAKTYASRLTAKGQTTIPVEVREKLGISPGDLLQYVMVDGRCEIVPRNRPVESLFGLLEGYAIPDTSIEDYRDAVEEYFVKKDDHGNKGEAA